MGLQARDIALQGRFEPVDLSLQKGEVTVIIGPNGAGKSSLLASLAGLLPPSSGSVTLGGNHLSEFTPRLRARKIGYLPQTPEIAWDVTVETLVSLGRLPWQAAPLLAARSSDAEDAAAIDTALTAMDLQSLRSRPVSRLSGGERARALAARVLAGNPDWILADEPLANLDLAHAAALVRLLRKEAEAGRGIVMVLHDLAMAMNHADRIIVLDQGRVVGDGYPESILTTQLIEQVWKTPARWLGEAGAHALVIG